jgi:hypothetical protein
VSCHRPVRGSYPGAARDPTTQPRRRSNLASAIVALSDPIESGWSLFELFKTSTYGDDVGRAIGHPPNILTSYHDEVALDCESRGEPDLTVLVVSAAHRVPSKFNWRPVDAGEIDREAWMTEVQRVRGWDWDWE